MRARGLWGFWVLALLLGRTVGAASCLSWPGEPAPLPSRADADALRALWATLRSEDLSAAALAIESEQPIAANRLWRHVLCLDPAAEEAKLGVERTPVVHVVRPPIERAPAAAPPAGALGPWSTLEEALALPARNPSPTGRGSASRWDASGADVRIREAREQLLAARFSESLASAAAARRSLASAPRAQRDSRVAELEILAATAELALGRDVAAQRSLARALRVKPDLALDPARTSPKVMRALEAARAARGEGD
jgi:hypothetical protein